MQVHRRVSTGIKFVCTHLYTWVERGTVRVKCLAQELNTMSPAGAWTWPGALAPVSSALTMRPPFIICLILKHCCPKVHLFSLSLLVLRIALTMLGRRFRNLRFATAFKLWNPLKISMTLSEMSNKNMHMLRSTFHTSKILTQSIFTENLRPLLKAPEPSENYTLFNWPFLFKSRMAKVGFEK